MAEFDLTKKNSQFLDRHLIFPLLEFISAKSIYNENDMLQTKLELLQGTRMVDYALEIYQKLHRTDDAPEEFAIKRVEVVSDLKRIQGVIEPVLKIFSQEVMEQLASCRDAKQLMDKLEKEHGFKVEMLDDLYTYAQVLYNCGSYARASETLYIVRALVPMSDRKYASASWGKLASEILMQNWEGALEDLQRLKEFIDNLAPSQPLLQLQQRTWLLHWSLFVFFNHPKGKDLLIEWFLQNTNNLNAIQTLAPHLLRYLAACVIINNKKKKQVLKEMVKVIQQESYMYRDPITEFLECLYVNFDFDGAQQKLRICESVLANDFFLTACDEDFIENARLLIFETFCRIHHCISIGMLAEKLNMNPEEAERWIVNLIRNARLDAKIDSKLGHVVMGTQAISPYQQVLEKTKNIAYNSQKLIVNIEKKLGLRNPGAWAQE